MMKLKPVLREEMNAFFMADPKLMYLGLSDEEIYLISKNREYPICEYSNYLGIFEGSVLQAIVKFENFTNECINLHLYLGSIYQNQKKIYELKRACKAWLNEFTDIKKVIMMVPSPCDHVHRAALKLGFKKEGHITNCYSWRQVPCDLIIYGLNIREKE